MQVHQIIHHSRLQVIFYPVDDDLVADINQLAVRQVLLVFIQRLVHFLVVADAVAEILRCNFWVLTDVIGRCCLHLLNVGHDQLLIVAFALDK